MLKKVFHFLCIFLMVCALSPPVDVAALGNTDNPSSTESLFNKMLEDKEVDRDYKNELCQVAGSHVAVIAIHGGDIEPYTSRIAALIAGGTLSASGNSYTIDETNAKFNYYSFKGLLDQTSTAPAINFDNLFLRAVYFDGADALRVVSQSTVTLSVIGIEDEKYESGKVVYIGGLDSDRKTKLVAALQSIAASHGFKVLEAPLDADAKGDIDDINGDDSRNICNKNQDGKGLQMAISRELRNELATPANKDELKEFATLTQGVLSAPVDNGGSSGSSGGSSGGKKIVTAAAITAPAIQFTDIEGHWAETNILKAAQDGYMTGYPDGTFRPNDNIKRAEFVVALVKALKLDVQGGKAFSDTESHWARDYIATAAMNGIINGNAELFNPDQYISRQEIAQMLANAGKAGIVLEGKPFSDYDSVSLWARNAVNWVSLNNIMIGYPDNTFRPTALATRAEAATILVNFTNH